MPATCYEYEEYIISKYVKAEKQKEEVNWEKKRGDRDCQRDRNRKQQARVSILRSCP